MKQNFDSYGEVLSSKLLSCQKIDIILFHLMRCKNFTKKKSEKSKNKKHGQRIRKKREMETKTPDSSREAVVIKAHRKMQILCFEFP